MIFTLNVVIYMITCKSCTKQYTGKSTQYMHLRHGGHRSEVDNESSELGEHFAHCGMDNIIIQIIHFVRQGKYEAAPTFQANKKKLNGSTAHLFSAKV